MPLPDSKHIGVSYLDAIRYVDNLMDKMDAGNDTRGKSRFAGPWVIRGIAGSGKTVRLCQIAAAAHANHPDWDIVLTFQTRSLYDMIHKTIQTFCIANSCEWNENDSRLRVMHAWGDKNKTGLYREIASANQIPFMSFNQVKRELGDEREDALQYASLQLLNVMAEQQRPLKKLFDLVLIDESQDLITHDPTSKFAGKEPFFWMAFSSLRPADPREPQKRRLVWAYDEYQNLYVGRAPKARELFGDDPEMMNTLTLRGEIASKCYRTPHEITIAAHAICMGLYSRQGMLVGPHNKKSWNSLGYEVEGEFISGRKVLIRRPLENSANKPTEYWRGLPIYVDFAFSDRIQESTCIARDIKRLIEVERIKPEHILVVCLDENAKWIVRDEFARLNVSAHLAHYPSSSVDDEGRPDAFIVADTITITGINRAKGNEARAVYVLNLDTIADHPLNELENRNSLYIGMTRSKGWLHLSGLHSGSRAAFYDEINRCLSDIRERGLIEFVYGPPKWDPSDELADEVMWKQSKLGDF